MRLGTSLIVSVVLILGFLLHERREDERRTRYQELRPSLIESATRCGDQTLGEYQREIACRAAAETTRRIEGG